MPIRWMLQWPNPCPLKGNLGGKDSLKKLVLIYKVGMGVAGSGTTIEPLLRRTLQRLVL